jgi:hypothetical protein
MVHGSSRAPKGAHRKPPSGSWSPSQQATYPARQLALHATHANVGGFILGRHTVCRYVSLSLLLCSFSLGVGCRKAWQSLPHSMMAPRLSGLLRARKQRSMPALTLRRANPTSRLNQLMIRTRSRSQGMTLAEAAPSVVRQEMGQWTATSLVVGAAETTRAAGTVRPEIRPGRVNPAYTLPGTGHDLQRGRGHSGRSGGSRRGRS